jgi:hypothetical protein
MSDMSNQPSLMDGIRSAAAAGALRSKLGRWFARNHAEFADTLERFRPRWETLVETFVEQQMIEPPSDFWSTDPAIRKAARRKLVDTVRKTWLRVDARARARAKTLSTPKPPTATVAAPPPPPAPAMPEPDQHDDEPEFTTLRGKKF